MLTTLKSLFTNNPLSHGGDELAYMLVRHEAIRIGVCTTIEGIQERNTYLPEALSTNACEKFLGRALWYGQQLRDSFFLDGARMLDSLSQDVQTFTHATIYKRIVKLIEK